MSKAQEAFAEDALEPLEHLSVRPESDAVPVSDVPPHELRVNHARHVCEPKRAVVRLPPDGRESAERACFIQPQPRGDARTSAAPFQRFDLVLQALRMSPVISVVARNVRAPCHRQGDVLRDIWPDVDTVSDELDARIKTRDALRDVASGIATAIVHDDQLEIGPAL